MNPITAIVTAAAVSAATTMIVVSFITLALGHVQNDRNACYAASNGHECALFWEVVP